MARRAKAPLGLIILLGALTAFGPVSIDMYLPAIPALTKSLHAADAAGQWTVSAFLIGISVGQLFYGPISDRFGRRQPLLFGITLYLIATLGCAFAVNIQMLIVCRVLQAMGACASMVISRAMVRDLFAPEEVLHVFSMLMLVMGLAPILAPLIGGWILLVADWRWIFGVQAAFAIVMGLVSLFTLKESRSAETAAHALTENAFGAYSALLSEPRLLGYLLTGAFSGAALFTYIASSPTVVMGYFHIPPQAFGWVFGINAAGLIGASQMNARLARRFPSDLILERANLLVFATAFILLVDTVTGFGGIVGVLLPLFIILAGLSFNQANASAGALNVDARRTGSTAALMGASAFGAGACASGLAGFFHDGTPRPMAAVILGSLVIAVISLQTLVLQPKRRAAAARLNA